MTRKVAPSTIPPHGEDTLSDEPSLWAFAVMAMRRPMVFFGLPLAFAAAAAVIALVAPTQYTASATFVADDNRSTQNSIGSPLGQLGMLLPQMGSSAPQFYGDLLQSRGVLRDAVLATYKTSAPNAQPVTLARELLGRDANTDETVDAAIERLRRHLSVTVDRVTGVVRYSVTLPDRQMTLGVAQQLLVLVNQHHLRRRQEQARAESEFLAERLGLAKQDLETAEAQLAEFQARNRSYGNSPELSAEEQRLQRQVIMRQQLYVSIVQNYETSRMTELRDTPPLAVIDRPEGLVQVADRAVLRKSIIGFLVGAFLGVLFTLLSEYLRRTKQSGDPEYREFRELWSRFTRRFRKRSAWARRSSEL